MGDNKEQKKAAKAEVKQTKKRNGLADSINRIKAANDNAKQDSKRSADAAERNARIRQWQLIIAAIVGAAVILGVAIQVLRES